MRVNKEVVVTQYVFFSTIVFLIFSMPNEGIFILAKASGILIAAVVANLKLRPYWKNFWTEYAKDDKYHIRIVVANWISMIAGGITGVAAALAIRKLVIGI